MSYSIGGIVARMGESPIHLGTFLRNSFKHLDLFTAPCPKCGRTLYPYGYNGSPLSGRVDLEATCYCGWDDYVMVSGWRIRSETLKAMQKTDLWRYRLFKMRRSNPATIKELLDWLHQ